MAVGWFVWNGDWYYTDPDTGVMQTGWLREKPGVYYYLYEDGRMAADTVIDGYRLGPTACGNKDRSGRDGQAAE